MSTGRFFAALFLALPFAAPAQSVTVVDRIVAVVNKEVVTLSELNDAVGRAERQLRRQNTPAPEREVLERQMLERLILEKAQLQMARETGIRVDELQLDRAVQRIAESNKMALAEFRRALEADGVSFELWREDLRELFAATLLNMNPGDVSEVLRSPAGFHVLKLVERRGAASSAPVTQTRLRHILVRTSDTVSESEARRRLRDLRDRIVNGKADFAELARVHSDDGTASRGGELDWIYPGDTVPDFERAYEELKEGEISQPVRTPFGYHLIQVLERRSAEMNPERRRLQARQVLRERKSDEAYQEWLRQLRDQSYVEVRLDER